MNGYADYCCLIQRITASQRWLDKWLTAYTYAMPTKRTFDLIVLTVILIHPVKGLFKMVATRKANDDDTSVIGQTIAGAGRIMS